MVSSHHLETFKQSILESQQVTVLTGAGISAESGIPTFRGKEGYWSVGSQEYHPQEMATLEMFRKRPLDVWEWYCYRLSVCAGARPNPGHMALVRLEEILEDRFTLITQNVDGLHLTAGSSLERTFQIHGNIHHMRCSAECSPNLYPIPDFIPRDPISKAFSKELLEKLRCPNCGQRSRPHVLWFDESYDEMFFRFNSSLDIARKTDLLLIVGTSGATTLPNHIVQMVIQRGGLVFDINLEANLFGELASENRGYSLQGPSGVILPQLVDTLEPL